MTTKATTTKNLNADEARAALRAAFRLDDTAGICEGKTAAEWHAEAGRHAEAQAESFERCDTDGFVSQWCHGLNRGVDRAKADIAAKGGQAIFAVLVDAKTGAIVSDRRIDGQFGTSWLCEGPSAPRKWVPVGGGSTIQKKLGLVERMCWRDAGASIDAQGHGFSGLATAHVTVYPKRNSVPCDISYTRDEVVDLIDLAFPGFVASTGVNRKDFAKYGFSTLRDYIVSAFAAV